MTEENPTPQTPIPLSVSNTTQPGQPPIQIPSWKELMGKLKPGLTGLLGKFSESGIYANKKLFWSVSVSFGLIVLLIIAGLLFGNKRSAQTISKLPTPSPVVESTPEASQSGDVLIRSGAKLNDLKNQINNLDVNESRLTPPVLNFDIKF